MTESPLDPPAGKRPEGARIRVMHVLDRLALAGTEYGVIKVLNGLDPSRFEAWLCCLRPGLPLASGQLLPHVRLLQFRRREGRDVRLLIRMVGLLRRLEIQVVHSHNWSTYAYTVVAARLAGVSVVIHGEHGRESDTLVLTRRRRLIERCLAPLPRCFTAVSRNICEQMRIDWRIPEDRIHFIPNGVDLSRFRAGRASEARASLGFQAEEPLIGMVSGFRPVKDHRTLLRAFHLVKREIANAKLILVGFDSGGRFRRSIATEEPSWSDIASSVCFLGVRTDIPEIVSALDVAVNCSVYEGMSNTILESMACGKPVVATAVGGNPDLVEDGVTGFLVPPKDPPALAEKIIRLLRDEPLAQRMGNAGRRRIEERHTLAGMVRANADLYLSLHPKPSVPARRSGTLVLHAARVLSRGGILGMVERLTPAALNIICYHRVLPQAEKGGRPGQAMMVSREVFEKEVAEIARRYRVLDLAEAAEFLQSGRPFPRGATCITFDDGYADNYEHALPILMRHGIPATFFLTTDPIDTGEWLWWDRVIDALGYVPCKGVDRARLDSPSLPASIRDILRRLFGGSARPRDAIDQIVRSMNQLEPGARDAIVARMDDATAEVRPAVRPRLMLSWDEVRAMMSAGMRFGGHTLSHAILDLAKGESGLQEVRGSLDRIGAETGVRPWAFSYPRGQLSMRTRTWLTSSGVRVAVTTQRGGNREKSDPLALRRLDGGYLSPGDLFDAAHLRLQMTGALNWPRPRAGAARPSATWPAA